MRPAGDGREGLVDKLAQDLGGALLARHHPDALAGHQRAAFDIAVDDSLAQGTGPEMLDLELRVLLRQLTAVEAVDDLPLYRAEALGRGVGEGAHRDYRKPRIELGRRHRVARRGANKGALEMRVGDRFVGADKAGAELDARGSHL